MFFEQSICGIFRYQCKTNFSSTKTFSLNLLALYVSLYEKSSSGLITVITKASERSLVVFWCGNITNLTQGITKNFHVGTINYCFCRWNLWQFWLQQDTYNRKEQLLWAIIYIIMLEITYDWRLIVVTV